MASAQARADVHTYVGGWVAGSRGAAVGVGGQFSMGRRASSHGLRRLPCVQFAVLALCGTAAMAGRAHACFSRARMHVCICARAWWLWAQRGRVCVSLLTRGGLEEGPRVGILGGRGSCEADVRGVKDDARACAHMAGRIWVAGCVLCVRAHRWGGRALGVGWGGWRPGVRALVCKSAGVAWWVADT